ncbi:MAG: Isoprenyl transferase [Anaerolineales bacterium]|nr:Isoprenyl transferase [Anaerolineales bacterium]
MENTLDNLQFRPRHVGIMMDGNGRWAQQRRFPRLVGHRFGTENVRRVLEACERFDIRVVTLYVFSTENWGRPEDEITGFFRILEYVIDREAPNFHQRGIQLRHLGSLDGVPEPLAQKVREAVELTKDNENYILGVAFNYGGRQDMLQAARQIVADGVPAAQVTEDLFDRHLDTAGLPPMDLVIRTGGERRLSNFFPWQAATAEFYVTSVLWPDFNAEELRKALMMYDRRTQERRQVENRRLEGYGVKV